MLGRKGQRSLSKAIEEDEGDPKRVSPGFSFIEATYCWIKHWKPNKDYIASHQDRVVIQPAEATLTNGIGPKATNWCVEFIKKVIICGHRKLKLYSTSGGTAPTIMLW